MSEPNYILSKKPTGSIVSDTILPASLTGLRGPKGDLGPGNTLAVGGTTTGFPGTNAIASLSGMSPNQQLFFTIPGGKSPTLSVGATVPTVPSGTQGAASLNNGTDGLHPTLSFTLPAGADGPANTLDVLSTTTGTPGTPANVAISGTAPYQHLRFTVPAGQNGSDASVTSANITAALGYTPIGDAPINGLQYARLNGGWSTVQSGNVFDQSLNTTSDVRFHQEIINGNTTLFANGAVSFAGGTAGISSLGNLFAQNFFPETPVHLTQFDGSVIQVAYAVTPFPFLLLTGDPSGTSVYSGTAPDGNNYVVDPSINSGFWTFGYYDPNSTFTQLGSAENPSSQPPWQVDWGTPDFVVGANSPLPANLGPQAYAGVSSLAARADHVHLNPYNQALNTGSDVTFHSIATNAGFYGDGNVLNLAWNDIPNGSSGGAQIGFKSPEGFNFALQGGGTGFSIQADANNFSGRPNISSNFDILFYGGNAAIGTSGSATLAGLNIPFDGNFYPAAINIGGYASDPSTGNGLNAASADTASNALAGWPTSLSGFANDVGFVISDQSLSTTSAVQFNSVSVTGGVTCNGNFSSGGSGYVDNGLQVNNGVDVSSGDLLVSNTFIKADGSASFANGAAGFSSLGVLTATNFPQTIPVTSVAGKTGAVTLSSSDISGVAALTANTFTAGQTVTSGTITTSAPALALTQTWNAAGTTFTALKSAITNTASAAESLHFDFQVGGSSVAKIHRDGNFWTTANFVTNGIFQVIPNTANASNSGGTARFYVSSTNNAVARGSIGIHSGSGGGAFEVAAYSGGANIWEQRNGTNAQVSRLYLTYTDASNYSRLSKIAATDRYSIAAESAGTGALKPLELSAYSSSSDPTSSLITAGRYGVWKNTTSGIVKLWYNDGGTMKSIALV